MEKVSLHKVHHSKLRILIQITLVIFIAMVIEIIILTTLNKKNSNRTSLVLLNQVVSIIEENEHTEKELIETLKEDYIIRAQAVAYLIDSNSSAENSVTELQKISEMMKIDEIHLFDSTGTIYSGTEPKYYGYNFDSGEQMAYFKPMLEDKSLTMCQDVTPNTAEGKSMMYAITWNGDGDKMVQVGIEPLRLLEELRNNEISEVISNIPTYDGITITVADISSGEILAATSSELIGTTLSANGIDTAYAGGGTQKSHLITENLSNYTNLSECGDYIVAVTYSMSINRSSRIGALAIELTYLLLAGAVMGIMLRSIFKANDEKNEQLAVLVSMADIYNSMHLINLTDNTITEYNARDEISTVSAKTSVADEFFPEVMKLTTREDFLEEALLFTDVHTLAERMKDKKSISHEFISTAIGWYRGEFITIDSDHDGYPESVIYVTQNIDKEKKKEEALIISSNMDELTGLYNRHAYETDIAEYNDAIPEDDFTFVSLDVNGLKKTNDSKGHAAGDELLMGAAECINKCFSPYGKVYRIGGDEFVALIFVTPSLLNDIKKEFEKETSLWKGKLIDSLSISAGYVISSEAKCTSIHEMSNIADKKMYETKSAYYKAAKGH